ncbi:MAG: hypothetical protein KGI50_02400 [Patescibacteria group bacterium]|nr:hypothetical protein [Patescibacteria group bacterium]MDE2437803.1 hypothetical protein [Patescibacteria group bacterium]
MHSKSELGAGVILLSMLALPHSHPDYDIALLRRRFYEWERTMITLGCIKYWRGEVSEPIAPHAWTKLLLEVFWNETVRELPVLDRAHLPTAELACIKDALFDSILRRDS